MVATTCLYDMPRLEALRHATLRKNRGSYSSADPYKKGCGSSTASTPEMTGGALLPGAR
jgi:hypothetical protein